MVGISELSNCMLVLWPFCCCGSYAYFSNFDNTSGNFLCFSIGGAVILVLVFSQLSLISFPKKAHVVCWPLQAVKHPHSCLFTLLSGTGKSIGGAKVRKKKGEKSFHAMIALEDSPHSVIPLPRFLLMSIILYDAEYSIGQFGSVILLVSSPNFLCTLSLLTGDLDGKKKTLRFSCSTHSKHFCVISCFSHKSKTQCRWGCLRKMSSILPEPILQVSNFQGLWCLFYF